ncbi:hypothetical protein BH09VER1_BH09VER1_28420 [soil metagenome]
METEEEFLAGAEELARLNNLTIDRAQELLSFIGDTPELDAAGLVVVRDDQDREIARVVWPSEE